jgi:hypothetical protein
MTDTNWKDKLQGIDKRLWELSQCLTLIQANTLAVDVIDIAADLSAIEQEETSKGWISVEERLPQYTGQWCICADNNGNVFCAFPSKRGTFLEEPHGLNITGVTHWMPLPEPPKESE